MDGFCTGVPKPKAFLSFTVHLHSTELWWSPYSNYQQRLSTKTVNDHSRYEGWSRNDVPSYRGLVEWERIQNTERTYIHEPTRALYLHQIQTKEWSIWEDFLLTTQRYKSVLQQ